MTISKPLLTYFKPFFGGLVLVENFNETNVEVSFYY